jgi:hypothetical protein
MLKINLLNTAQSIRSIDSFLEGSGKLVNEITVDEKTEGQCPDCP